MYKLVLLLTFFVFFATQEVRILRRLPHKCKGDFNFINLLMLFSCTNSFEGSMIDFALTLIAFFPWKIQYFFLHSFSSFFFWVPLIILLLWVTFSYCPLSFYFRPTSWDRCYPPALFWCCAVWIWTTRPWLPGSVTIKYWRNGEAASVVYTFWCESN